MLLAVDIGNTDIVYGVHNGDDWKEVWRTPSVIHDGGQYEAKLRLHFLEAGLSLASIRQVVFSSVVPPLNQILVPVLTTLFGIEPVVVGIGASGGLKIAIDFPHEIGSDLIANSVAAYQRYQRNCVVVDFGTALTFTTVSAEGSILGVAIVPGLKTSVKALFANTAQLPEVPLKLPQSAIGKNTVHSIQAGILMGYEGLVRGLIQKIRLELNGDCIAIATGGLSSIIDTLQGEFVEIDKLLTLDGLRLIGEYENVLKK